MAHFDILTLVGLMSACLSAAGIVWTCWVKGSGEACRRLEEAEALGLVMQDQEA